MKLAISSIDTINIDKMHVLEWLSYALYFVSKDFLKQVLAIRTT